MEQFRAIDGGRPSLSPVTVAALFWLRPRRSLARPAGWAGGVGNVRNDWPEEGGTSAVKPHLQWIVKAPVVVSRPRQEGGRDGGPCCCGDVEKGVAGGAGGGASERRGCDTGEVDAQREASLLQSFLWHGEGLQLLLSVGHVGVLAATADTVQTRLR